MQKGIVFIVILLSIFIVMVAALYALQRSFIYFPDKRRPQRDVYQASDMEKITLETADGLSLLAWYKPPQPEAPTIVYFHGNAGHIGYRIPFVRQFINAGYGVFLLEYRGYGGNPGSPSEVGLYKDAEAAIHFLLQRGITAEKMVLYGESLGTAVATRMAVELPVCAVILQSPMSNFKKLAQYHYPWVYTRLWDKYDSLQRIDKIQAPLLILHGQEDVIVPIQQAELLFSKANEPKQMIRFKGLGHNNLWNSQFYQQVLGFIKTHCD